MTIDDIRLRLDAINEASGDCEVAHGMEDDLYLNVLEFISRGRGRAAALAAEALKAQDIEFPRYTA